LATLSELGVQGQDKNRLVDIHDNWLPRDIREAILAGGEEFVPIPLTSEDSEMQFRLRFPISQLNPFHSSPVLFGESNCPK
jgi:hypothetical protein